MPILVLVPNFIVALNVLLLLCIHRIGENVPDAIYVEAPLNQVDAF